MGSEPLARVAAAENEPQKNARSSDISFGGYWPQPRAGGDAGGGGGGVSSIWSAGAPLVGLDAPISTQSDGRLSAAVMSFRSRRMVQDRFSFSCFYFIYLFS